MTRRNGPELHPDLLRLVEALARLAAEQDWRETQEAAAEIAELRAALGLDDDFPAWKRKAEGLMKAFYAHVPRGLHAPQSEAPIGDRRGP